MSAQVLPVPIPYSQARSSFYNTDRGNGSARLVTLTKQQPVASVSKYAASPAPKLLVSKADPMRMSSAVDSFGLDFSHARWSKTRSNHARNSLEDIRFSSLMISAEPNCKDTTKLFVDAPTKSSNVHTLISLEDDLNRLGVSPGTHFCRAIPTVVASVVSPEYDSSDRASCDKRPTLSTLRRSSAPPMLVTASSRDGKPQPRGRPEEPPPPYTRPNDSEQVHAVKVQKIAVKYVNQELSLPPVCIDEPLVDLFDGPASALLSKDLFDGPASALLPTNLFVVEPRKKESDEASRTQLNSLEVAKLPRRKRGPLRPALKKSLSADGVHQRKSVRFDPSCMKGKEPRATTSLLPGPEFSHAGELQLTNFKKINNVFHGFPIVFETASLSTDGRHMDGSAHVANLAFEKRVSIRYTWDEWQTQSEVDASYKEAIIARPDSSGVDRFQFRIPVPEQSASSPSSPSTISKKPVRQLEFALRYEVAGDVFWDNARGENYRANVFYFPARGLLSGAASASYRSGSVTDDVPCPSKEEVANNARPELTKRYSFDRAWSYGRKQGAPWN